MRVAYYFLITCVFLATSLSPSSVLKAGSSEAMRKVNAEINLIKREITRLKEKVDQIPADVRDQLAELKKEVSRLNQLVRELSPAQPDKAERTGSATNVSKAGKPNGKPNAQVADANKTQEILAEYGRLYAKAEARSSNMTSAQWETFTGTLSKHLDRLLKPYSRITLICQILNVRNAGKQGYWNVEVGPPRIQASWEGWYCWDGDAGRLINLVHGTDLSLLPMLEEQALGLKKGQPVTLVGTPKVFPGFRSGAAIGHANMDMREVSSGAFVFGLGGYFYTIPIALADVECQIGDVHYESIPCIANGVGDYVKIRDASPSADHQPGKLFDKIPFE